MREKLYDDKECRVAQGLKKGRFIHLEGAGDPNAPIVLLKHMTTNKALASGLSKDKFDSYTKISVCRNPYTLIGSMMRKNLNCTEFSEKNIRSFLKSPWMYNTQNYLGQAPLLREIDKIIKFEDIVRQFEVFKEEFSIKEDIPLVRYKKPHESIKLDYVKKFTRCGIDFVNEWYSEDFKKLGYDKL